MLARSCWCDRPQVFEDSETCNRCGHGAPCRVTASTMRLAVAVAEVILERRTMSGRPHRSPRRTSRQG